MDKPIPPSLHDYGLTEQDLVSVPKLLNQRVTHEIHSNIGLVIGIIVGVGSLWGMFVKTASILYGAFFGILIGFVVFLMVSFLGSLFVMSIAEIVSRAQRFFYSRRNEKARQVYRYFEDHKKFDKAMLAYNRYRQKQF